MKYQPDWIPRFACYDDARMIPRVGVASSIAEGFLVLPFSSPRQTAHRPTHFGAADILATGLLRTTARRRM